MKFAASRIDITPNRPVHLGAAGDFKGRTTTIESRLEANVLCLAAGEEGRLLVIVSLDLLYPGANLTTAIRNHLSAHTGSEVFVCASHTHRAPMTDPSKPGLGIYDGEYTDSLMVALKDALDSCLGNMADVEQVRLGESLAPLSINRRLKKRLVVARQPRVNAYVNAPNGEGPTDDIVTLIEIRSEAGIECILWNYACHPVGHPSPDSISSHYPGWVREAIRRNAGANTPVLFLQGFSGNTRPSGTAKVHTWRRRLRRAISGRLFEDFRQDDYEDWCRTLTGYVLRAQEGSVPINGEQIATQRRTRPAADFLAGQTGDVELSRVSIGDRIEIYFATAELMVEHSLQIRREHVGSKVIPVGCVGPVIGYLPTPEILQEGGYEGGLFTKAFGVGRMSDDAGDKLAAMFADLLARTCSIK